MTAKPLLACDTPALTGALARANSGLNPAFPGLWQIQVKVPDSAAVNGHVPVFVAIGTAASNGVTVQVNR